MNFVVNMFGIVSHYDKIYLSQKYWLCFSGLGSLYWCIFFVNVYVCVSHAEPKAAIFASQTTLLVTFPWHPQKDDETVWHYSVRCISDVTSLCRPALMQGCFAPKANVSLLEVGLDS